MAYVRLVCLIGHQSGNRNALKHGLYTAEAIASRREVAALIRAMRHFKGAGHLD